MNKRKKRMLIHGLAAAILIGSCLPVRADAYTYDKLNRLKKVTYEDGSFVEYEYDDNGNMKEARVYNRQKAEEEEKKRQEEGKAAEEKKRQEEEKAAEEKKRQEEEKAAEEKKRQEEKKKAEEEAGKKAGEEKKQAEADRKKKKLAEIQKAEKKVTKAISTDKKIKKKVSKKTYGRVSKKKKLKKVTYKDKSCLTCKYNKQGQLQKLIAKRGTDSRVKLKKTTAYKLAVKWNKVLKKAHK